MHMHAKSMEHSRKEAETPSITTVGFQQSEHDACMFLHSEKKQMIIIYVDDMLLAADGKESMSL